jgi:cell division protease FtsH
MERETLQAEDIAQIFKPVKKLPLRTQWLSKKTRPVSKQGPIAIPVKGSSAAKAKAAAAAAKKAEVAAKPATKKPAARKPAAKKTSEK